MLSFWKETRNSILSRNVFFIFNKIPDFHRTIWGHFMILVECELFTFKPQILLSRQVLLALFFLFRATITSIILFTWYNKSKPYSPFDVPTCDKYDRCLTYPLGPSWSSILIKPTSLGFVELTCPSWKIIWLKIELKSNQNDIKYIIMHYL